MVLDSAPVAVLVAGALACVGVASRGDRRRPASLCFAAALAVAAGRELLGAEAADSALAAAGALVFAGIAALVVSRTGRPTLLSWLDAAMAVSSVGALAVSAGATHSAVIAVGGVAGGLALSRWRVSPALAGASLGLLLLGAGGPATALAAVPLVVAAFLREPFAGPGPEFNPVVLAAVLIFASISLTLLTAGQFMDLPPVAAVLAIVTVLAGMARAGLTVVQRLDESHRQAITDDLTGLGNRRHLLDQLQHSIEAAGGSGGELALLLIDLDGFKELNDALGHAAGDEVLRHVAEVLAQALRTEDLASRWGGEEFLVLLPDVSAEGAAVTAERLRAAIAAAPGAAGAPQVTASFGWATWNGAESVEALVARADDALYAAKGAGRNRVAAAAPVA
jgi:diguanylate cyclase (GGDEF)-like protein